MRGAPRTDCEPPPRVEVRAWCTLLHHSDYQTRRRDREARARRGGALVCAYSFAPCHPSSRQHIHCAHTSHPRLFLRDSARPRADGACIWGGMVALAGGDCPCRRAFRPNQKPSAGPPSEARVFTNTSSYVVFVFSRCRYATSITSSTHVESHSTTILFHLLALEGGTHASWHRRCQSVSSVTVVMVVSARLLHRTLPRLAEGIG
jgi:hypothetical protein